MIARSSGQILFFKLEQDPKTNQRTWQKYWTLKIKGQIYTIKGNDFIYITDSELI
jgi:hypothetical protein